jgi:hypothetical protein
VGCEQRPAKQTEWPGPERVTRNRRQPPTDVVERAEQSRAATEHRVATGDPGWSDKREPANTVRLLRSQLRRDQAAKRMPDEIHTLEIGRLETTAEPAREPTCGNSPAQPR